MLLMAYKKWNIILENRKAAHSEKHLKVHMPLPPPTIRQSPGITIII